MMRASSIWSVSSSREKKFHQEGCGGGGRKPKPNNFIECFSGVPHFLLQRFHLSAQFQAVLHNTFIDRRAYQPNGFTDFNGLLFNTLQPCVGFATPVGGILI